MKILTIIGSPRKGNTYRAVQQIEQIHKKLDDCEYEYLFLKDLRLELCKGCLTCITHGEDRCPLKDDRDLIVQKITDADGVILASPNYVKNVPALMKNFIDRFSYVLHRPMYFRQRFMFLVTSGSYMGANNALSALSVMSSGGETIGKLTVFQSPGMNELKLVRKEAKLKKAAEKFAREMRKKFNPKPSFSFLMWFSVFKASSKANQQSIPADYAYYKDKQYFTDVPLNIAQKAVIAVFTAIFGRLIKMGLV